MFARSKIKLIFMDFCVYVCKVKKKSKNSTESKSKGEKENQRQIQIKRKRKKNKTKVNCFVNLKEKKSSQDCSLPKLRCLHQVDEDARRGSSTCGVLLR